MTPKDAERRIGSLEGEMSGVRGYLGNLDDSIKDLTESVNEHMLLTEGRTASLEADMKTAKKNINGILKNGRNGTIKGYVAIITIVIGLLAFGGIIYAAVLAAAK